jgi:hypothetical protein
MEVQKGDTAKVIEVTNTSLYREFRKCIGVIHQQGEGGVTPEAMVGDAAARFKVRFVDTRPGIVPEGTRGIDSGLLNVGTVLDELVSRGLEVSGLGIVPVGGARMTVRVGGVCEVVGPGDAYWFTCGARGVRGRGRECCGDNSCLLRGGREHVISDTTLVGGTTTKARLVCWEALRGERTAKGVEADELLWNFPFDIGGKLYQPRNNHGDGYCMIVVVIMHILCDGSSNVDNSEPGTVYSPLGRKWHDTLRGFVREGGRDDGRRRGCV